MRQVTFLPHFWQGGWIWNTFFSLRSFAPILVFDLCALSLPSLSRLLSLAAACPIGLCSSRFFPYTLLSKIALASTDRFADFKRTRRRVSMAAVGEVAARGSGLPGADTWSRQERERLKNESNNNHDQILCMQPLAIVGCDERTPDSDSRFLLSHLLLLGSPSSLQPITHPPIERLLWNTVGGCLRKRDQQSEQP